MISFGDDFVGPDVVGSNPFEGGETLDSKGIGDDRVVFDGENVVLGIMILADGKESSVGGFDGACLLMPVSGKEEKVLVTGDEFAAVFVDATAAEDEDLPASSERLADACPLFEAEPDARLGGSRRTHGSAILI
jgi:hypothetical protein